MPTLPGEVGFPSLFGSECSQQAILREGYSLRYNSAKEVSEVSMEWKCEQRTGVCLYLVERTQSGENRRTRKTVGPYNHNRSYNTQNA